MFRVVVWLSKQIFVLFTRLWVHEAKILFCFMFLWLWLSEISTWLTIGTQTRITELSTTGGWWWWWSIL